MHFFRAAKFFQVSHGRATARLERNTIAQAEITSEGYVSEDPFKLQCDRVARNRRVRSPASAPLADCVSFDEP